MVVVFTDGACANNGRSSAKAGYAVWFPAHSDWSVSGRVPETDSQTNQRAELLAIHTAVRIMEEKGCQDEDIVIYTDSEYSMNCLTKWLPGWVSRGWKTSAGSAVLHQDLIRETSGRLAKFKSHRFVHVRAHTGKDDMLSKNNDIVDRMARNTIDDTVREIEPPSIDDIFPNCPLRIMGPPVSQTDVLTWIRGNLDVLDSTVVNKHLLKAFAELCKPKEITLTKQILQKTPMLRAERSSLQITHVVVEKVE